MIYVGIDVAKDKHDCHIVRENGEILLDNFSFPNSKEGFDRLDGILRQTSEKIKDEIKIGLEYTGHYSQNLLAHLKEEKYEVIALNPLQVNLYRKTKSFRNTKTDKSDARFIAKVTAETEITPKKNGLRHIATMKSLSRYRYRLLKTIQSLKNRYRRVLEIVFPEFEHLFNLRNMSTVDVLAKYSSPREILSAGKDSLERNLNKLSHGHYGKKADELLQAAEDSIGTTNLSDAFELKHLAKQISFLSKELEILEDKLASLLGKTNTPILSIPGIGVATGAAILSEIGNIKNFDNPAKLLAFAGCEPAVYQSGKFLLPHGSMVKNGSKYLRNAIFQATKAAYVSDPFMRAYVNKKREEGKHFFVALTHGMKKMTRIIFAVLRSGKPYTPPRILAEDAEKEYIPLT